MLLIKLFISDTDGMFVKFAPLTAGKVAGNLASGIVPDANLLAARAVMLESGIFVKFAPDPENVVAVHTPVKNKSPSSKAHWRDQYRWNVSHRQAYEIAKCIAPFAITKQEKLLEIVNHYVN